jgi:cytochrome c553
MKKLTVLSMIAAALLLTACGDSATGAEAKAATETTTEAPMKCGEGKCGDAMKKEATTEAKTATEDAKEAVSNAAEKVKEAASETVASATTAVKDTAASAVDKVKEAATAVKDTATDAATAVKEKATDAVAAVTGPDGKALYAKCAGCHGADGKTAAMGKSALVAGEPVADLEAKLHGYKAGTQNAAGMGMLMKGQVASMSDEEIKAVSEYMSKL